MKFSPSHRVLDSVGMEATSPHHKRICKWLEPLWASCRICKNATLNKRIFSMRFYPIWMMHDRENSNEPCRLADFPVWQALSCNGKMTAHSAGVNTCITDIFPQRRELTAERSSVLQARKSCHLIRGSRLAQPP